MDTLKNKTQAFLSSIAPSIVWDEGLFTFLADYCSTLIKGEINRKEIPAALEPVLVRFIASEILKTSLPSVDGDSDGGVVSSIKEGDTSITYAVENSKEVQLSEFIEKLRNGWREECKPFRRVRW